MIRMPLYPIDTHGNAETLCNLQADKFFIAALRHASPSLTSSFLEIDPQQIDDHRALNCITSVISYYNRMCFRATPFGLFAGIGIAKWGNERSRIGFRHIHDHKIISSPKYIGLHSMQALLDEEAIIDSETEVYLNSTLVKLMGSYRYYTYDFIHNNLKVEEIEASDYVNSVVALCRNGMKYKKVINYFVNKGFEKDAAQFFIKQLLEGQVLFSPLTPKMLNGRYSSVVKNVVNRSKAINSTVKSELLNYCESSVKSIGQYLIETDSYQGTDQKMSDRPRNLDVELSITNSMLNKNDLLPQINNMWNAVRRFPYISNRRIKSFTERFENTFGERPTPLLIALDPVFGLRYGTHEGDETSEMLHGLPTYAYTKYNSEEPVYSTHAENVIVRKIIKAISGGGNIVNLTDDDLRDIDNSESAQLAHNSSYLPCTVALNFSLLDSQTIKFNSCFGSSSINSVSRFTSLTRKFDNLCNEVLDYEAKQYSDKNIQLMEVSYVSNLKGTEILARNIKRNFSLDLNYSSGENLLLSDLFVQIVEGDLILFDSKSGVRLEPVISTADQYNYVDSPIYQFLCDFQFIRKPEAFGYIITSKIFSLFDYIPRIVFKGVILAAASWKLDSATFEHYIHKSAVREPGWNVAFQKEFKLPDMVYVVHGDHKMFINLSSELQASTMLKHLIKDKNSYIEEYIPKRLDYPIKDDDGKMYEAEILAYFKVPFSNSSTDNQIHDRLKRERSNTEMIDDSREIAWSYYKIYCRPSSVNDVLVNLYEYIRSISDSKIFFIRYNDPDHHIRIRVLTNDHVENNFDTSCLAIGKFIDTYSAQLEIDRYTKLPYIPEYGRYGFKTVGVAEALFCIDSDLYLEVVRNYNFTNKDMLVIAVICVDILFDVISADTSVENKIKYYSGMSRAFKKEQHFRRSHNSVLRDKFRTVYDMLLLYFEVLYNKKTWVRAKVNNYEISYIDLLFKYKDQVAEKVNSHIGDIRSNDNFLFGVCHMSVNRKFESHQRTHETLVYSILEMFWNRIKHTS
jgi:thiopeptide-type bacteriocin biosynthesis protein